MRSIPTVFKDDMTIDQSWSVTEASSNNSDNEGTALTTLTSTLPFVAEPNVAVADADDVFGGPSFIDVSTVTGFSNPAGFTNFLEVNSRSRKTDGIMKRKVADIIESYRVALGQAGCAASYDDLVALLRQFETFPGSGTLQLSMVLPIIRKMTQEFRNFALQQRSADHNAT